MLPHWSPDGKQIAFSGGDPGHPPRLYVISADGGTPRVVPAGEFQNVNPSWMPDGNSLVFLDTNGTGQPGVLKMVNINTRQVTAFRESKDLVAPGTSPDGRYLAGSSIDGKTLFLFDFSTSKWSELLKTDVGWTNWSMDGKYIYFDTGLGEKPAVFRVRVADRKVERIADLKGFRRVVFGWLPWSGVTPDGEPLLLRDVSSQEVYALDFEAP